MEINIRLSLDAPRGWKRRVLLYVATPIALVAAASALAYAYNTNWIADNQPVSASALKEDLDEIQSRLVSLETAPQVPTSKTFQGVNYVSDVGLANCFKNGGGWDGTSALTLAQNSNWVFSTYCPTAWCSGQMAANKYNGGLVRDQNGAARTVDITCW